MNAAPHTIYVAKPVGFRGPYKIGVTSNLERRFRHICNASPIDMELIGSMPGDKVLERRIHARLLPAHIRCEWFRDCLAVRAMAASIKRGSLDIEALPAPIGVTSFINGCPVNRRNAA